VYSATLQSEKSKSALSLTACHLAFPTNAPVRYQPARVFNCGTARIELNDASIQSCARRVPLISSDGGPQHQDRSILFSRQEGLSSLRDELPECALKQFIIRRTVRDQIRPSEISLKEDSIQSCHRMLIPYWRRAATCDIDFAGNA
jgi:hypothetical protein